MPCIPKRNKILICITFVLILIHICSLEKDDKLHNFLLKVRHIK